MLFRSDTLRTRHYTISLVTSVMVTLPFARCSADKHRAESLQDAPSPSELPTTEQRHHHIVSVLLCARETWLGSRGGDRPTGCCHRIDCLTSSHLAAWLFTTKFAGLAALTGQKNSCNRVCACSVALTTPRNGTLSCGTMLRRWAMGDLAMAETFVG